MRSIEQRIAEINRRSAEIIRKRKRNRRVLVACVPLLCVALCAVFMLPGGAKHGGAPESMKDQGSLDGADMASYPYSPIVAIKLTSSQESYSYDDPQELERVLAAIDAIFSSDQILGGIKGDPSKENNGAPTDATADTSNGIPPGAHWEDGQGKYTIQLVHENGTVTKYTLQGSTLWDAGTGRAYTVPEDALAALWAALEIDKP